MAVQLSASIHYFFVLQVVPSSACPVCLNCAISTAVLFCDCVQFSCEHNSDFKKRRFFFKLTLSKTWSVWSFSRHPYGKISLIISKVSILVYHLSISSVDYVGSSF